MGSIPARLRRSGPGAPGNSKIDQERCQSRFHCGIKDLLKKLWVEQFCHRFQAVHQAWARAADQVVVEDEQLSFSDGAQVFPTRAARTSSSVTPPQVASPIRMISGSWLISSSMLICAHSLLMLLPRFSPPASGIRLSTKVPGPGVQGAFGSVPSIS